MQKLLRIGEVAERLSISPQTIYNNLHEQRFPIPAIRIGRAIRFHEQDVEDFIDGERSASRAE